MNWIIKLPQRSCSPGDIACICVRMSPT